MGDEALAEIAGNLRDELRSCDELGRMGGDEFLAILPQTDLQEAKTVANRLRKTVEEYVLDVEDTGQVKAVTASIGVAAYPENGARIEDVLAAADAAVYQVKERGGNGISVSAEFSARESAAREWVGEVPKPAVRAVRGSGS